MWITISTEASRNTNLKRTPCLLTILPVQSTSDRQGRLLITVITLNPDRAIAYNYRADAKAALNDPHGAITDANTAIALKGDILHALLSRGSAHAILKNFSEAIDDFTMVINREPKYTPAL